MHFPERVERLSDSRCALGIDERVDGRRGVQNHRCVGRRFAPTP
jgi:hypothetical protein